MVSCWLKNIRCLRRQLLVSRVTKASLQRRFLGDSGGLLLKPNDSKSLSTAEFAIERGKEPTAKIVLGRGIVVTGKITDPRGIPDRKREVIASIDKRVGCDSGALCY